MSTKLQWMSLSWSLVLSMLAFGQPPKESSGDNDPSEAHTIILSPGRSKPLQFLYAASVRASIDVRPKDLVQTLQIQLRVLQGEGDSVSLGLSGEGEVTDVQGTCIAGWGVRSSGGERYLDLQLAKVEGEKNATVRIRTKIDALPATIELAHLTPGRSLALDSQVEIRYSNEVSGKVVQAAGFAPMVSKGRIDRLQTTTGGKLVLSVDRQSALPPEIDMEDVTLVGQLHPSGKSIAFEWRGIAQVRSAGAKIHGLSGQVALSQLPNSPDYRLALVSTGTGSMYELQFPKEGRFPISLDFVAPLQTTANSWYGLDFRVAASAVVPVRIKGFDAEIAFAKEQQAMVPMRSDKDWLGFLPATGRVLMRWQDAKSTGEGKSFFTTNTTMETTVGPGLMRQEHRITFQLLQGQLNSPEILLKGPGEILSVEGEAIIGWRVEGEGTSRKLDLTLNRPLTGNSQIIVRSQTPLGPFPVRVDGLTLHPQGAVRSSGHLRIANSGSVRVEATALRGLTQLAPEQFPGEAIQARQLFVYRFPSADYGFTVVGDRVQPEVSVTQLVLYQLSETDRVIIADMELDIREAAIREWSFGLPSDYSVVSVVGASVADYIVSSESMDGERNLKVLFGQDVQGRQLVSLRLEKNEAATSGTWTLPRIRFPEAKGVRGDIGIVAAPGFRATVGASELLVEKPLSYFPRPIPNLQQAFRMRDPDWSASMQIEKLERSIQSDMFHLYSLSQGTIYGSALINYSVTGAPVSEWQLNVPASLGNVTVDGQEIRTWRREGDTLMVSLHRPVLGAYTLLVTFEEKPNASDGSFQAGLVAPLGVQSDRGFIEVVSPIQVEMDPLLVSNQLLVLDSLELPAEFRLLSTAPALGTWQYTQRPFDLRLKVRWFDPGTTVAQVVEFSEAKSRVSPDGELVTDLVYYVKSRGERTLRLQLPAEPVRLWAVSVNGRPVTARQAGSDTLIPLPGNADLNAPIEVSLRLGKPASDKKHVSLALPKVFAPVLKTQWNVQGDENHLLIPEGGTVEATTPTLWPTGLDWIREKGLIPFGIVVALVLIAALGEVGRLALVPRFLVLGTAMVVSIGAGWDAFQQYEPPKPLVLSLPVLASGEAVGMEVRNLPSWQAAISWMGVAIAVVGLLLLAGSWKGTRSEDRWFLRSLGIVVMSVGVLWQPNGGIWFFGLLAAGILIFRLLPMGKQVWLERAKSSPQPSLPTSESPSVASSVVLFLIGSALATAIAPPLVAQEEQKVVSQEVAEKVSKKLVMENRSFQVANASHQKWEIQSREQRLKGSATLTITGKPGDQFLLLRSPAVLTQFDGPGLRLSKVESANQGVAYVVTIPREEPTENRVASNPFESPESLDKEGAEKGKLIPDETKDYSIRFDYQLEAIDPTTGIPVLTGPAALQKVELSYDVGNWELVCAAAAQVELLSEDGKENTDTAKPEGSDKAKTARGSFSRFRILLGPGPALIQLRPQARDIRSEETQFFVEGAGYYAPGPGVIDGKHRLKIRTSQGRVQQLGVTIPEGLTVSSVEGPVSSWQFDAEKRRLLLQIESKTPAEFAVVVETQRSLEALPAEIELWPLRVEKAGGEVGLIALAFGTEAQPENLRADSLSLVNLGDFDVGLISHAQTVLHRVYRYGVEEGSIKVQVAPVAPEVRVQSKQVMSLGDERIVLGIQFIAEITRTGLFQLSFPLPNGFEVESLTGESLHHWSELSEQGKRQIVLHLKGKTIGPQKFTLTLAGPAPTDASEWTLPRFVLNEAPRQSGEMVVQPITGIRLRTLSRQNVSEADPRAMGGQGQGALAFRLLQSDWSLQIGIEKLAPWITGNVLHDVTLREGQTRSVLLSDFVIQNAAIRTMQVKLPSLSSEVAKTLRANGETVSDFVKVEGEENLWEVRFKRRVIGPVQFQLEFERRGERSGGGESLIPIEFPEVKQIGYYFAVRSGGRLEVESDKLTQGWQRIDWSSLPNQLREAGNRNAPALALRAITPTIPLQLQVIRHSLAEALKLRVASGKLTTILSPTGDQLTSVDLTMEVIQRSSLSVQLPTGGELFSIFVNGESVHSIRQKNGNNVWQFYILPGIDDRTAQVRLIYSLNGEQLSRISLASPQLNVPLENIQWDVISPSGYLLIANEGNLELVGRDQRASYDRQSYLSSVVGKRQDQAQQAAQLLEQANQLLQTGEQGKAQWAFNNVANRNALDAASNEDARVQLENLQTQQAIVGLNTRRQRLFLDSNRGGGAVAGNEQMLQAAATNPILQQEQLNYRPQELSQLLAGNSKEENAILQQIAGRLVQHQRTTESAPQAITISLPEEGNLYSFRRSVQVAENAPLDLQLRFHSQYRPRNWQWLLLSSLVLALSIGLAKSFRRTVGSHVASEPKADPSP